MADLRAYFAEKDHRPSADHWDALGDVVSTLAAMAAGTCPAKVHLAALDPGVGKSSAVLAFARALLASPERRSVGMVVCVGRVAEAVTMAEAILKLVPGASLAVLTAEDEANALSTAKPNAAQVLITTQQRIERATETRGFEACEAFHYQGAPRAVRAWDEAWLPGVTVNLSDEDLMTSLGPIRALSKACGAAVKAFGKTLSDYEDGAAVDVPDFEADHGVSLRGLLANERLRQDQRVTLAALAALCGKTGRVQCNGYYGAAVLTYRDTLPEDLAPLLVLDASGRVRETYRLIGKHRGGLVSLREAVKDYSPLNVHVWTRSGGKSAWAEHGGELVQGIVETICERPDEQWLVVAHQASWRVKDVEEAIRGGLPEDVAARVSVITWGNHMASNLYAEHPNVILAGTLFMPPSHYTALTHLAQDADVAGGLASKEDVERITRGEHANVILQALCRGRVRRSDGDRCHPMNAYVIASKRSGIPEHISTIFPGCQVHPWRETINPLPKLMEQALSFVRQEIATGSEKVTNTAIRQHVGMRPQNFASRIIKDARWPEALEAVGLEPYVGKGSAPGGVTRASVSS